MCFVLQGDRGRFLSVKLIYGNSDIVYDWNNLILRYLHFREGCGLQIQTDIYDVRTCIVERICNQ